MAAITDLSQLLAHMEPVLHPPVYVFATVPSGTSTAQLAPVMRFSEAEGETLIIERDAAQQAGLHFAFPSRMITLNVHSSLDAVGFLAAITRALADAGMGVNPVSAFYHDHLFVPEDRAQDAMEILAKLVADAQS
ncbi:MAG: ACT domain-containing protein [Devosiaceae bacterium]|nr:ACT domain-containing protein [Devosiaceae bacterium MH13]